MGSDSAECGDVSNPQNGEYNEDEITEPLLACLQKITMYLNCSKNGNNDGNSKNGKFNKDQIKELITCVIKITKILDQSLKNNTRHNERNLIEKRNRAKNTKVYNSHDVIREFCNTIKNIGCPVSDNDKQAEGPSLAKVVAGTSRSNIEAIPVSSRGHRESIPGTSQSHTEAIPGTSRSHTEAIPGTSRSNAGAIQGTSRSNAGAIQGSSRSHTEAIPGTSRSNAEAIQGTSRSNAEAIQGTSRSHAEEIQGTSRSHAEAIQGTSRSHTETIPGTSRGYTVPARTGKSTNHTIPVLDTPRGNTDFDGTKTPKSQAPALAGNCRNHIGAVPVTYRSNEVIPGKSRSDTDVTDGASRILTDTIPGATRPHINAVAGACGSITDAVPGTSRRHTEEIAGTSGKHPVTAATEKSYNVTISVPETSGPKEAITGTSRGQTESIAGTSRGNTKLTEGIPKNSKGHTEATAETLRSDAEPAVKEKIFSRNRAVTEASRSHTEAGLTETPKGLTHRDSGTPINHTEPELIRARSIMFWPPASPTKSILGSPRSHNEKMAEASKNLQKDPENTPVDVEPRKLTRKRKRNSALVKIIDPDIIRNQAVEEKITAKSESTLNRHIEQGSAISSLNKITNTHDDNKSTDDRKRNLTENCALNGRTEETITNSTPTKIADADKSKNAEDVKKRYILKVIEKPDSTPKSPNEQATSNSTPVKTSENDKENKTEDKNKRKTTKAKDSTQDAHVERVVTNSTLTNDKQAADAKKKTASISDNSDSMPNDRMEETTSNSTLTKMSDTKAEELMNGKKRKKIEKDFGSQKNTYSTINLTSGNDFDEPKAPTAAFIKGNSGPAKKDEPIIYISYDTYNPAEEKNQSMKVIQESGPKPEDIDQVLKDQEIDVDEDTCLYDLAQEESTIRNSGPKTRNHDQILNDEPAIDLSEGTCLYEASQQKTSGTNKKSSSKNECDEEIMNVEQATNSIHENRSEGENVSATNLEPNKETNEHPTELLEEREVKCAEYLLATNVKKEQASKDPGSSNTVVISCFFPAQPNQNNQKSNDKSTEQNTTHIKQRLQGNCNSLKKPHDKVTHARKRPHEESKNEKNKLKVDKIIPDVTITSNTPDSCVTTSSTLIPTPQNQKTNRPSSERHTSNAPVNKPELSISELIRPPNRPLTHSAIESILLQAAQIALPNLSITTSTASSEYRTQTMETPSAKLNPVTSKRPSTDSRTPTKRDDTKPGGRQTNPVQMNANIHQNVLLQKNVQLDCRPNATSNSSPQYRSTESRSDKPKPDITGPGQFSKRDTRTKSSEQPTDSFKKKARTVPPGTVSETRSDSTNFTSMSAEYRSEKPKPVTIASKRPSSDSRPFPKTNTGAKPKQQNATDNPIHNGQINQAVPASSEWRHASLATLLSPSQHRTSGNTVSLSTNGLDFATGQSTNAKPIPTSQSTPHAVQGSPKLASSRPQVHSAPNQNSNSNRTETNSNNVQSPQIDWYKPVPIQNLTPNRNSQNLNSHVTKANLKRKSSTKNHSYPIQSWHRPVLSGNEPGLPQTVTSSLPFSSHQSSLPHHLRLRLPIQEPAYQRIPTGRPMADAVRQLNRPMCPLLVPKNQAAMMENQKSTVPTQPTWHIPTEATDI